MGSALCAGNYSLTNVLPTAPDMAQFKQGVRSVAGKLSVFANGVMTSIQVGDAGVTGVERGVAQSFEREIWTIFNCRQIPSPSLD